MNLAKDTSRRLVQIAWPAFGLVALLLMSSTGAHAADFQFDFQQNGTTVPGGNFPSGGTGGGNDGSLFIQDRLTIGGVDYWHVVVGDPATGFSIESYVTSSQSSSVVINNASVPRGGSPDGGGNERAVLTTLRESLDNLPQGFMPGNAKDPLGITVDPASGFKPYDLSGNGTMNPTRMTMRMTLSDSDISLDIFKPFLDRKPLISQTTLSYEPDPLDATNKVLVMSGRFVADMRGVSYSTLNKIVPITNSLILLGSDILPEALNIFKPGAGDFDMGMAQRSNVTAGQYTFTPGAGWSAPTDPNGDIGWDVVGSTFDEGTYTYADGGAGFNVYGVKWENFFDSVQNANACSQDHRKFSDSCP